MLTEWARKYYRYFPRLLAWVRRVKKILFLPTLRCNYKCEYCYLSDTLKTEYAGELDGYKWLSYLNRFKPYHLEITGGEPLLYKDILYILNNIPAGCTWAITSNTSRSDVIDNIKAGRCISWTASYHYGDIGAFLSNLERVKKLRIFPSVTLVVSEKNIDNAYNYIKIISGHGYRVNVHPEMSEKQDLWKGKEQMLDKIISLSGVKFIKSILSWNDYTSGDCQAGTSRYFGLMPDGTVIRCQRGVTDQDSIGHIADFEPYNEAKPCARRCLYPCDKEIKSGG